MQYVIGLVVGLIFFIFLCLTFYAGYKFGKKVKPFEAKVSKEEQDKLKRRLEGLQNMMNYDFNQALGVKNE